jgi:hypothetical protein
MTNQCTQIRTRIGSWNVRTLFQKGKLVMKVGSTARVISGLSPGFEKSGEDLWTTYVPNGNTDIIIITICIG